MTYVRYSFVQSKNFVVKNSLFVFFLRPPGTGRKRIRPKCLHVCAPAVWVGCFTTFSTTCGFGANTPDVVFFVLVKCNTNIFKVFAHIQCFLTNLRLFLIYTLYICIYKYIYFEIGLIYRCCLLM